VLVIGAGAGYGAALLAHAGIAVTALESEARLDTGALAAFAPDVHMVRGPLAAGWAAAAPFDAILIEGAICAIPERLAPQLVPKGRLVSVLEGRAIDHAVIAERAGDRFAHRIAFDCAAPVLPEFRAAPAFVF
jgi:protein-L-isoaspartate(D-aspartate) O-methyltransferase